jgi:TetR/AcrR family transcriptional regulator
VPSVTKTLKGQAAPSPRDPERTRARILAAALKEFSAKGLAGARVDLIARRASINKRMLYHYFGNKKELFRAVLEHKMAHRAAWLTAAPEDPMEIMPYWFDLIGHDTDWIRLLEWEALQEPVTKIVNESNRRKSFDNWVARISRGQAEGKISQLFDPRHVVLSISALIVFPLAFPQLTKLVTGLSATDPKFQRDRVEFLSQFAAAIRSQAAIKKPLKLWKKTSATRADAL